MTHNRNPFTPGLLQFAAILLCALISPFSTAADTPTLILVIGAEGEPEFGREFLESADLWLKAASAGNVRAITIGRDAPDAKVDDKTRLQAAVDEALKSPADQPLWLVLIGHGTFDGREAKFNLRGPDFSDAELAEWLKPARRPVALVDCSSASAPFLTKCSAPGRVVITATRAGQEIQFARFGKCLAQSINDPAADLDKDGQTSLLEAFLSASHRVEEFYKSEGRLATEHAILDDTGDGRGTAATFFQGLRATRPAKDNAPLDGPRAHQWHLVRSPVEQALSDSVRKRRDEIELQIETLRTRKATLAEADYYGQLEPLLIELARLYASTSRTTSP